jgi:hypothetical protein
MTSLASSMATRLTVASPAAIISTTPIPKCSFHMVWMPTAASPISSSNLAKGTLTSKATSAVALPFLADWLKPFSATRSPSSCRGVSTLNFVTGTGVT